MVQRMVNSLPTLDEQLTKLDSLERIIYHTPVFEVDLLYKGSPIKVWGKHEGSGYSGSTKDRIAHNIIKESYLSGELKPGDEIVEVSSGNTGIAFATFAAALGHKMRVYITDWLSPERYKVLDLLGAEVVKVSREEGSFPECRRIAKEYASTHDNVFYSDQFSNSHNVTAQKVTIGELFRDMKAAGGHVPTHFIAGVGTGGTAMACLEYCKEHGISCRSHPLEPDSSPILGHRDPSKGSSHRIQGISDDLIPEIVELDQLDSVLEVNEVDSISMARKMLKKGIICGISCGANLLGCLKVADEYAKVHGNTHGLCLATVFADTCWSYLSRDLEMDEGSLPAGAMSPHVEVVSFEVLPTTDKHSFSTS